MFPQGILLALEFQEPLQKWHWGLGVISAKIPHRVNVFPEVSWACGLRTPLVTSDQKDKSFTGTVSNTYVSSHLVSECVNWNRAYVL